MKKISKILFFTIFSLLLFFAAHLVSAADPLNTSTVGVDQVAENIKLSDRNPIDIASRIINLSLIFLGLIGVSIVLWGGFVWMKSNGNSAEIDKAKGILRAGLIGLILVMASWGIASFVIGKLLGVTGGNGGTPGGPGDTCVVGAPCLCGGHTVCNEGIPSCIGSDCPTEDEPINCSSTGGETCTPSDNLCGSPDKVCNTNCVCENIAPPAESCGLKEDGSCDINGGNCSTGTTCNPNSCLCEGPITITGVSPIGGFCENNPEVVCESTADCSGAPCDKTTPNGAPGNFLTVFGRNFDKTSNIQPIFKESFNYPIGQTPGLPEFSEVSKGNGSDITIERYPNSTSSSLFFYHAPGLTDASSTDESIAYDLSKKYNLGGDHVYKISFRVRGNAANRFVVTFGTRTIFYSLPRTYNGVVSVNLKPMSTVGLYKDRMIRFRLYGTPNGSGTSLYIDDLKIYDSTANQAVLIDGMIARAASEVYPGICAPSEDPNQIIVVVPQNAQNGKLEVKRGQEIDSTSDNNGPKINDFVVNSLSRPGVCRLNPSSVRANSSMSVWGTNMTGSYSYFGNYQNNIKSGISVITNTNSSVIIPQLAVGTNTIFFKKGKFASNYLPFTILPNIPAEPVISGIYPSSGNVGQYVMITGRNFGNSRGAGGVYFGHKGAEGREANYLFPAECAFSLWSDSQILVKVPAGLDLLNYNVQVVTNNWSINSSQNNLTFAFDQNAKLAPGICKIDPSRGPVNSPVTLFGEYFGNPGSTVKVFFNNLVTSATVGVSNLVGKVETLIPSTAVSGPVKLQNDNGDSNSVNFQVGACENNNSCDFGKVCCPAATYRKGQCLNEIKDCFLDFKSSVFEWTFNTAFNTGTTPVIGTTTPPTILSSCLGISNTLGSCQTNSMCPNVPGKCSSATSTKQVPKGNCCPVGYLVTQDGCIRQPAQACNNSKSGSFCKTLANYSNKNRLVYSSSATCDQGWIKINGDLCALGNDFNDLKSGDNCSLCQSGESCVAAKCVLPQKCQGAETCINNICIAEEAPTCECCCDKNNGAADCCAPLTCGGSCGSGEANLGVCSGCAAAGTTTASRDAACNCSGHNGQFCAVSPATPSGACVDCATLSFDECMDHSDVCCLDDKNLNSNGQPACKGGAGNLLASDPGYCAYFDCAADNKSCNSGNPKRSGDYSSISSCEASCKSTTPANNNLGLNCGVISATSTVQTCDASMCGGAFATPFKCLLGNGSTTPSVASAGGSCGVCCCSPGDNSSCQAINPKLSCQADRGDCSGGSRGLCCGCSGDSDCGGGSNGCGFDTCCYPKPQVWEVKITPKVNTADEICRNTAIQVPFTGSMDHASINSGNVLLLEEHAAGYACPTGTLAFSNNLKEGFFVKIYNRVEKIFVSLISVFKKDNALADASTTGHVYCKVPVHVSPLDFFGASTGTMAVIKPKTLLAKKTDYIIVVKGNSKTTGPADGVLSLDGVGMNATSTAINNETYPAFIGRFKTKNEICEIDYTKLTISEDLNNNISGKYLFSSAVNDLKDDSYGTSTFDTIPDRDKVFYAKAFSADNQLLATTTGYSWNWEYQVENPALISTSSLADNNKILTQVSTSTNDGKTLLYATVKMPIDNLFFGGNNKKTSAEVFVFICANPWPRIKADGTWEPWRDTGSTSYNYDFYYCRDAGGPGKEDDLPEVSESQIAGKQVCSKDTSIVCSSSIPCPPNKGVCIWDILKEYYFFSNN